MAIRNKEDFIEKSRKVHGNKYDYSKVEYLNTKTKVCIICPIHGEFWQRPNDHISGKGCSKCSNNKTKTSKQFIEDSIKVHGNKYDYSKVEYINAHTKVCIICPIHGEFWQTPDNHLHNKGCPKCKGKNKTTNEVIEMFKAVHGDDYDYSKVEFKRMNEKVCIICKKHGEFQQTPNVHLTGCGCPKCGNDKSAMSQKLGLENFLNRAKQIHGDKYDYSKVNYINFETKVCIICPKHGEFWQLPYEHLIGKGCQKCAYEKVGESKAMKYEEFIERANEIHEGKYTYERNSFVNASSKTLITCPVHGEFWQTPDHHLNGNGCPFCNESKLEKKINRLLSSHNIKFIRQFRCHWLGRQSLDFYIPEHKIAIECQGIQHYKPTTFGSKTKTKEECFELVKKRDAVKKKLCEENGVKLLYFSDIIYDDNVLSDENKLLKNFLLV